MHLATASGSADVTLQGLVTAAPGQIIRVTSVLLTCWQALSLALVSDPEGAATPIIPTIYTRSYDALNLRLGRRYAIHALRGQGLGFSLGFMGTPGAWSLAVWYEVVD